MGTVTSFYILGVNVEIVYLFILIKLFALFFILITKMRVLKQ